MPKGSDIFVAALENEGVDRIFGIPGEENLDLVESLRQSSIELVLTRHEQAAAFMAATHGRLTGTPGVCLATLGPGALNFSTGAAYAHLGAMPMILITGQKAIMTANQARFQIVDVVASMKPLTKMTRQIVSTGSIPSIVRDAFRVADEERPGPVHLELPEDVAGMETGDISVLRPHPIERPVPSPEAIARAVEMVLAAKRPVVMIGAAGNRPRLVEPLSAFVRAMGLPFFNTQMGKGAVDGGSNLYIGTAALSERDYVHEAIDRADLVVSIGHDTVEKPPFLMRSAGGPKVLHVGYVSTTVEQVFHPDAELIGDIAASVSALSAQLGGKLKPDPEMLKLRQYILERLNDRADD
jgi:acetolactate synthase-1/2/3 large subunit